MARGKNAGRKPRTRRSKKLTGTQGILKGWGQVAHLDGLSGQHLLDVEAARRLRSPEEVRADWAESALLDSYYHGAGRRRELITSVWFGDAGVGFDSLDGDDGNPTVMSGEAWQQRVIEADDARFEWRDSEDKLRRARSTPMAGEEPAPLIFDEDYGFELSSDMSGDGPAPLIPAAKGKEARPSPPMSGQLAKIYARMPPWVALEAVKAMSLDLMINAVTEVAKAFQDETGRRVIAANIHAETDHDIHIHLTHTALVPERGYGKTYAPDYLKKMLASQRKIAKTALLKKGNSKPTKAELQAQLEELWNDGKLRNPHLGADVITYRRIARPKKTRAKKGGPKKISPKEVRPENAFPENARHHLVSMGPTYCSKTSLWEASGRDPRVAAVNEQGGPLSFAAVVVRSAAVAEAIAPEVDLPGPEYVYIDYWLSKQWTAAVHSRLSDKAQERVKKAAPEFVERYIKDGNSLPNPTLEKARAKAQAEIRGIVETEVIKELDQARRDLSGADATPTAATTVGQVKDEISKHLKSQKENAVVRGLNVALAFLVPGRKALVATREVLEKEITTEIAAQKNGAILAGFNTALAWLFPGRVIQGKTAKDVQNEIRGAISGKLADGFKGILKDFGCGIPKATTPDELEKEVVFAAGEFKKKATTDGLELAWRAIKDPDVPVPTSLDAESLRDEIQKIHQKAFEKKTALDNLTIELETDRKRLRRIPVRELCETLGLVVDKDDLISGSLESFNVPGAVFEYRGSIKGESFELEVFHHHHKGHGQHAWVKLRPGNGAIDFLCSLMPKPDFVLACKRLAEMFPDREGGILLGHVANKGDNLWNNVFPIPQPEKPAPQKTADPAKNDRGV